MTAGGGSAPAGSACGVPHRHRRWGDGGEGSTRKAARSLEVAWSEVGAFSQAMARRSSASSSLSCRCPQAALAAATACASAQLSPSSALSMQARLICLAHHSTKSHPSQGVQALEEIGLHDVIKLEAAHLQEGAM